MAGEGFKLRAGISQPPSACMLATPCPSAVELRVTVTRIGSAGDAHPGPLFNPSLTSLPPHLQSPNQPWPIRVLATEQGVWLGGPVHLLQACLLLPLLHRCGPLLSKSLFLSRSLYCRALHFHLIIVGRVIQRLRYPGDREGGCTLSSSPVVAKPSSDNQGGRSLFGL